MNSSPQPLLAQFQARYPTASLIAELLTIHQGCYVVRATVQMGGTLLATGMSAANDIEQAEDRAKVRALAAIGIETFNPAALQSAQSPYSALSFTSAIESTDLPEIASVPTPSATSPIAPSAQVKPNASKQPSATPLPLEQPGTTPAPLSDLADFSLPASGLPALSERGERGESPDLYTESIDPLEPLDTLNHTLLEDMPLSASLPLEPPLPLESIPDVQPNPIESPPPPAKGKSTRRKTEPSSVAAPLSPSSNPENDRSEEIAKIGVEMKRLGWTTDQGKNYLKRTYGKRSRQELSDDELIDFLRYLEAQPSPTESLF